MKSKKGFTLVEMLIAIMIFAVVMALAGSLFVTGFRNYEKVSGILTGQSNNRIVMYEISKELRNASLADIVVNETNTSITIGSVIFAYSGTDSTISKTKSGTTTVIARSVAGFTVELVGETVSYSIHSSEETDKLSSSVTLKQFDRPSPP